MAPPATNSGPKINIGQQHYLIGASERLVDRIQRSQGSGRDDFTSEEADLFFVLKTLAQTLLDLIGNDPSALQLTERLKRIVAFRTSTEIAREKSFREHY